MQNQKITDQNRNEAPKTEAEEHRDERIEKTGQLTLSDEVSGKKIHLLTIIGEIEGHENLSGNSKTTKYEHILPQLAAIEDSEEIGGVLVLLNTMGGDVEAGLAIAEMLASLSKPTVSLVLGGSHSIGVPIAVSCKYSFIVPTGTMVIHPVRMNGMVIRWIPAALANCARRQMDSSTSPGHTIIRSASSSTIITICGIFLGRSSPSGTDMVSIFLL